MRTYCHSLVALRRTMISHIMVLAALSTADAGNLFTERQFSTSLRTAVVVTSFDFAMAAKGSSIPCLTPNPVDNSSKPCPGDRCVTALSKTHSAPDLVRTICGEECQWLAGGSEPGFRTTSCGTDALMSLDNIGRLCKNNQHEELLQRWNTFSQTECDIPPPPSIAKLSEYTESVLNNPKQKKKACGKGCVGLWLGFYNLSFYSATQKAVDDVSAVLVQQGMLAEEGAAFLALTQLLFTNDFADSARSGCGYECRNGTGSASGGSYSGGSYNGGLNSGGSYSGGSYSDATTVEAKTNCSWVDGRILCDCTTTTTRESKKKKKDEECVEQSECQEPYQCRSATSGPCHSQAQMDSKRSLLDSQSTNDEDRSEEGSSDDDWHQGQSSDQCYCKPEKYPSPQLTYCSPGVCPSSRGSRVDCSTASNSELSKPAGIVQVLSATLALTLALQTARAAA